MKFRLVLAHAIFWIHVCIVLFWWGLFLVPSSWWANKISFHFYLTLVIIIHQFIWGLMIMPWTKKYRMVCILTTPMQLLRGQSIADPNNYAHSFTKEFLGKMHIIIPHWFSTVITFTVFTAVTIQYFFFR